MRHLVFVSLLAIIAAGCATSTERTKLSSRAEAASLKSTEALKF
jgi:hypothetical protein